MKSPPMVWVGRVLTGLFALFMLGASIYPKFFLPEVVAANMGPSGWTPDKTLLLGIIELTCLALYLIPRTAVLGAVLMMAYLGGALATNLRVDNPLFSHTLFSVYLGLVMWSGLWLRDARVRAVFPILRNSAGDAHRAV